MLAKQPFRVDGDRAYGLGISDDKSGVAAIIHALTALRKTGFNQYPHRWINGDEEISSPGSRALLTAPGSESDAVLSCESTSGQRPAVAGNQRYRGGDAQGHWARVARW